MENMCYRILDYSNILILNARTDAWLIIDTWHCSIFIKNDSVNKILKAGTPYKEHALEPTSCYNCNFEIHSQYDLL